MIREKNMFDPKAFEDLSKKLCEALPEGMQNLDKELKQKFKTILQSAFDKLDLVTREEFDVQKKVLVKTREKVEAIEKQLEEKA